MTHQLLINALKGTVFKFISHNAAHILNVNNLISKQLQPEAVNE